MIGGYICTAYWLLKADPPFPLGIYHKIHYPKILPNCSRDSISSNFVTPINKRTLSRHIKRQPRIAARPDTTDEPARSPLFTDAALPVCNAAVAVGGRIVVEPSLTPDGPIVMVLPLMTVVSVGAPEPIRKVDEPMTTSVASSERLIPSTVIAERDGAAVTWAGGIVDEARPTPDAPNEIGLSIDRDDCLRCTLAYAVCSGADNGFGVVIGNCHSTGGDDGPVTVRQWPFQARLSFPGLQLRWVPRPASGHLGSESWSVLQHLWHRSCPR